MAMIVRERYMRQIRDFMDKPVVKIITGMRRRKCFLRRTCRQRKQISFDFAALAAKLYEVF